MCYFCVPHLGKLFVFGCQVPTCFATWFVDGSRFRSEPKQKPMFIVPKQKPMFLKHFPDNFWNHFFGDREWVYVTRAYPGESESWPPMILPTWTLGRWVPKLPQKPTIRKEILHKLLVKHPGYLPGVCGWDLRKNHFSGASCYSSNYPSSGQLDSPDFCWFEKLSRNYIQTLEGWFLWTPSRYATKNPTFSAGIWYKDNSNIRDRWI